MRLHWMVLSVTSLMFTLNFDQPLSHPHYNLTSILGPDRYRGYTPIWYKMGAFRRSEV